jgi:hypothetical protein
MPYKTTITVRSISKNAIEAFILVIFKPEIGFELANQLLCFIIGKACPYPTEGIKPAQTTLGLLRTQTV